MCNEVEDVESGKKEETADGDVGGKTDVFTAPI